MRGFASVALRVLLALAIVLSVAIARQYAIGARSMTASDEALTRGDTATAIDEARSAAEARAPASPYPLRGYERLAALAHSAEQGGNWSDCARAWRAVRSAALSTRVLEDDGRERVREANVQLARIGAHARGGGVSGSSETAAPIGAALETRLQEDLARDEHPSISAYLALGSGGLLLYLGIASLLTQRPNRWPPAWTAVLAAAGTLLAALGCLLS